MSTVVGIPLDLDEKNELIAHAEHGRAQELQGMLRQLEVTKMKGVVSLILEATDELGIGGILHRAADHNRVEILDMVCNELDLLPGERITVLNMGHGQRTAAIIAASRNHAVFLRRLISEGASMTQADFLYNVPLHHAARVSATSSIQCLCNMLGADNAGLNRRNIAFQTPLHLALDASNIIIASWFIHLGADVEAQTMGGDTPLHRAVRLWPDPTHETQAEINDYLGRMDQFFNLIYNRPGTGPTGKTNIHLRNRNGHTPADIAVIMGHGSFYALLLAAN